jgi:hypothetical protein
MVAEKNRNQRLRNTSASINAIRCDFCVLDRSESVMAEMIGARVALLVSFVIYEYKRVRNYIRVFTHALLSFPNLNARDY